MKKVLLIIPVLVIFLSCKTQNNGNLITFAKVYGYVKYFHPSDEAATIDWSLFAIYGVQEIEKCRTKDQLVKKLNELFNPIAPSVRIISSTNEPAYDLSIITPANTADYRQTFWQHRGLSTGMINKNYQSYKSLRVNRQINDTIGKLFDPCLQFGEIITKKIGADIYCQVPLVLYCNDRSTWPEGDAKKLDRLHDNLQLIKEENPESSFFLGNIINIYNVLQHFYPYFDVVDVDWEKELGIALSNSGNDKTIEDHEFTVMRFIATLNDGHAGVSTMKEGSFSYSPPISWEWVEGKLVITKEFEDVPGVRVGDIVTEIDGFGPEKYFERFNQLVGSPTKGWHDFNTNQISLGGEKESVMKVIIDGKKIELHRKKSNYDRYSLDRPKYESIGNSTMYLNMGKISMDEIDQLMPKLESAKAIICDARGYPKGNELFLTHLMSADDTTSGWMKIPKIMYPDHEKNTGYIKSNWISHMKASKPYLGNKKIIYITDGRAISYAESCLGYVEGYKLATIIGQPSAGTNGNINPFLLPGGYTVRWTGMKVVRHDGSQQHGLGIRPDIYVTKTIQGIREGRDEFLEKAIELTGNTMD
jgi:hypothetical protein